MIALCTAVLALVGGDADDATALPLSLTLVEEAALLTKNFFMVRFTSTEEGGSSARFIDKLLKKGFIYLKKLGLLEHCMILLQTKFYFMIRTRFPMI